MIVNWIDLMSITLNVRHRSLVLWSCSIVFLSILLSSGVVYSAPGATSGTFAHTSGLVHTPVYCSLARWLLNCDWWFRSCNLYIVLLWNVVIVPSGVLIIVTPLKVVESPDRFLLGLLTNIFGASCPSRRNSFVPMEN